MICIKIICSLKKVKIKKIDTILTLMAPKEECNVYKFTNI